MNNKKIFLISIMMLLCSYSVFGLITDSLYFYASLDDNQATAIGNQVNFSNNGSITAGSPTYSNTTCVLGGCRNSTGTNEIIAFNNIPALTSSTNFSLSAWVKADCTPATKILFANTNNYIDFAFTGKFSFRTNDGGASTNVSASCVAGTWEFWTGVHYSNGTSILYKNGAVVNSIATTFGGTPTTTWQLFAGSGTYAKAQLDEVGLWGQALSNADVSALYNGGTGVTYPFYTNTTTPKTIDFISQVPSDLTATSLFSTNFMNITYNVSNTTGMKSSYLNYSIATNPQRCAFYLNESCYQQGNAFITKTSSNNNLSSLQSYILNDNRIYPATYNINESLIESTTHDIKTFGSNNDYIMIPLKNVSDSTAYNIFELYINSSSIASLFYCNSSYVSGSVVSDPNCIQFSSFQSTSFNHSHNQSKHNIFSLPINITTGRIGSVKVTQSSKFIIRQAEIIGSINISCQAQTSNNAGSSYSSVSYCPDAHLHQYVGNEALNYSACADLTTNIPCSDFRTDIIDSVYISPTSPTFTNPSVNNQAVEEFLNITYTTSSTSTSTTTISSYNITLLNSDYTPNKTLKINNNQSLSYYWNTYESDLSTGTYYIKIIVNDSVGNNNFVISQSINITTNTQLNISLKEYNSENPIQTYSLNLTDLSTGQKTSKNTSNYIISFDTVKGRTYNATIESEGYATSSETITIPNYLTINILNASSFSGSVLIGQSSYLSSYLNAKIGYSTAYMKADTSTTAICYVNFTYIDGTINNSSSESTSSTTYVLKTFNNPNPEKPVNFTTIYCYKSGSNNFYFENITVVGNYSSSYYNETIYIYTQNSVTINIFDEITLLRVTTQPVTVQFIMDESLSCVTSNGSLYVDNLTSGVWNVRFSGDNYTTKTYIITVNNKSTQTLNAYLTSTSNLVIFEVSDISTGVFIENASFTMEKLINSSYVITESKYTDIIGTSQFAYVPYTKYKFTIAKSGYSTKVFYLDPIIFATYSVALTPLSTPSNPLDFDQVSIIYYPKMFYNNRLNNFTFLISSPTGVLIQYAFNISYPGGSNKSQGILANGEPFMVSFNIINATTFQKINLSFNYTSTLSGVKNFRTSFEIIGTAGTGNNTMIQLKDNTYGLGLMERVFITMIIVVIVAGLSYALIGITGALLLGLIIHGMAVFFGFMPIGSIVISLLVGFLIILANSGGKQ